MPTRIARGRVYEGSRAIGRSSQGGLGFNYPVAVAVGQADVMYVLNRGQEIINSVPWNQTGFAVRVSKVMIGGVPDDEELLGEFCSYGDGDGQVIWATGIAVDSQENVYITDEWMNRVSIFDTDGNYLTRWGISGDGDGAFNGPSGIAIDLEDNIFIVDSRNHRVQKLTRDGQFLAKWGSFGSEEGQLNSPWGMTIDRLGYVYVADHRNHRAQKFTPDGEFAATFGSYGTGRGQLNHPSGVAVDPDGDVYVCDWANHRVQVFGPDTSFITTFTGDAHELSRWGKMIVDGSSDVVKARRRVYTKEPEWRFPLPSAVAFDAEKWHLIVADCQRFRIQIYSKLKDYVDPQFNL